MGLMASALNPHSSAGDGGDSAMPFIGESVLPWISASLVLGFVNVATALRGQHLATAEQLVLLLGLCGTVSAAGLVAARSHRATRAVVLVERARPAAEELSAPAEAGAVTYVDGMAQWTAAMLELIAHARGSAEPGGRADLELAAAAADTGELHDLMCAKPHEELTINEQAQMHALGSLWETNQARIEQLAADLDPSWHRRWRARSVVARELRHGHGARQSLVLPYGA